jgi:hypothetical protein
VDQIFGATQKLKNQWQKKEWWSIFLILKSKYVEDLTLDLSKENKNGQK